MFVLSVLKCGVGVYVCVCVSVRVCVYVRMFICEGKKKRRT